MMLDLPNSMTETTEDCSSHDNIFALFSDLDSNLRPLGPSSPDELVRPSSPAVSTDPEVMFISSPPSPLTHIPNQVSNEEPVSPDSTSTIEASDNDPAVEVSSTTGVQFSANDIIEDQHDPAVEVSSTTGVQFSANDIIEDQHGPPPTYSSPTDCSPVLSRPNQFKHRTETASLVNSRQNRREQVAPKPTAIIRPRINSRPRYSLRPEFDSWEIILWDNQRKELTIQNTSLPSQRLVVPHQAVTILPHQDS